MITPTARRPRFARLALALAAGTALGACGGGSGDDDPPGAVAGDDANGGVPLTGGSPVDVGGGSAPPPGDIARYGVLNLGDDGTGPTELVAVFLALPTPVAPAAFGGALDPELAQCRVVPAGGDLGFESISDGFLPTPIDVPTSSIASLSAGQALTLTSDAGTWAELQPGGAIAGTAFYTGMPPAGPLPESLVLDVPGDEFPAFVGAALPSVVALAGFGDDSNGAISPDTVFTWEASGDPDAKVRLSTASNFFSDPGTAVSVLCTVPDTGEFAFDADTRAALGDGFTGDTATASRVAIDTLSRDDALLILVREGDVASN